MKKQIVLHKNQNKNQENLYKFKINKFEFII